MTNVEAVLGTERAFVSFISRYRDANDYRLVVAGSRRDGRIRELDDGTIGSRSEHFSDEEARVAVAAYRAAAEAEYQRWAGEFEKRYGCRAVAS